ncbi:RNA polymerase sigma factor [Microlunatus sp. Y2014]|uniref:RNA polymerase sigma factor n=1 Tax=Microlunatus sp. Y2014 TaxID=3418488 RepID=UPI003DA7868B
MTEVTEQLDYVEDDVLGLMFLTCHPALTPESRAALCLRLVGGLTTGQIARAYGAKEATMAQRLSRAKRTLAEAGLDPAVPPAPADRASRLQDVMAVVYRVFHDGYTAARHGQGRPELCHEGLRLARILAGVAPGVPEVHGLQALLELQASRLPARTDSDGEPVLLEQQDRDRWDQLLIHRGLRALRRAHRLARPVGMYVLQAEIAACHARARRAEDTDWARIAAWYDLLARHVPSPAIAINRAVAHGHAFGPEAGLVVLDAVGAEDAPSHVVSAVRGDLLSAAGDERGATVAFRRAADTATTTTDRDVYHRRATACAAAEVEDRRSHSMYSQDVSDSCLYDEDELECPGSA